MKIQINGIDIEQKEHSSILEAVIAHCAEKKVLIEYQCKDGYCGSCRCKLLRGKVGYTKPTLAYLAENEILVCSTIALSDIELAKAL